MEDKIARKCVKQLHVFLYSHILQYSLSHTMKTVVFLCPKVAFNCALMTELEEACFIFKGFMHFYIIDNL